MDDSKTKGTKRPSVKNFLTSPFQLSWPKLDKGDNKSILDEIRRVFPSNGLRRGEMEQLPCKDSSLVSWNMVKTSLVIGVNAVTKALEKDTLALVLVCGSTKPSILTNHLILLSATRSAPSCAIFGLSEIMASLFGIKTVAACGFKKNLTSDVLNDLIEFIVCKIPGPCEKFLHMWSKNAQDIVEGIPRIDLPENFDNVQKKEKETKKGKKRLFEAMYVHTQIKTLLPSEKTKTKKKRKSCKTSLPVAAGMKAKQRK